ncbi:MAG: hypothetical protein ALAOOOJD_02933 [bacterium]|nr:hypothetical protein [bacterium]
MQLFARAISRFYFAADFFPFISHLHKIQGKLALLRFLFFSIVGCLGEGEIDQRRVHLGAVILQRQASFPLHDVFDNGQHLLGRGFRIFLRRHSALLQQKSLHALNVQIQFSLLEPILLIHGGQRIARALGNVGQIHANGIIFGENLPQHFPALRIAFEINRNRRHRQTRHFREILGGGIALKIDHAFVRANLGGRGRSN